MERAPRSGGARAGAWPARFDVLQSGSGVVLALFMWGHMFFVASILISEEAMWRVTRFFEGYFVFGERHPGIVSAAVAGVLVLFLLHGLLAARKLPGNWEKLQAFRRHRATLRHGDTTLWWVQAVTGVVIAVLGTTHLAQMLLHPDAIGPYASSDRVWSGGWWPVYLVLLFAVELHAGVGLYRVALKWGWPANVGTPTMRRRVSRIKWSFTAFFLVLGLLTLAAYMRIGWEHRAASGERFVPDAAVEFEVP